MPVDQSISLTISGTARGTYTILLFHQEANPKKWRAEKEEQGKRDPSIGGNSFCRLWRKRGTAVRASEASRLRRRHCIGLHVPGSRGRFAVPNR
jgi:hypothetical protein